ncbi:MAG TPA: hypothetical protein VEL76_07375 [Gemmataceae bacterium]|nr:hypothetical protein [Gemmataceae bacterium]
MRTPFAYHQTEVRRQMSSNHHFNPKLCKRRILAHADYTVYAVNGLAVRNVAQPDEEFGNFAIHEEFPDLIPANEIWISEKLAPKEGVFFIANALTQLKRQAAGATEKAYEDGLEVERVLRAKLNGVAFRDGKPHKQVPAEIYLEQYTTLPDPQGDVQVWLVDGNLVRSYYKTDYTEGGHGYVYPWVPRPQIWIEDGVDRREVPFIVTHEYLERRLMRDKKLGYDTAHEICSKVEFELRKGKGIAPLLVRGRRKLSKQDLPRLTSDEVFAEVIKRYVRS